MKSSLIFACILACAGTAQAQQSGPAAAYQNAFAKCMAGSANNVQAFATCMQMQGFSENTTPSSSAVGEPPYQITIQPYPMPIPNIAPEQLRSGGLNNAPNGAVSSPIQTPGNGEIPPGPYLVPPAFYNPGVPPKKVN